MKRAAVTLAVLLLAAPASALPILPPQPSAGCVLEEITLDRPYTEDKGWEWLQQQLGLSDEEIEARKAADKLWEPAPEVPTYRLKCPGGCQHDAGRPVPEPSSLALLAVWGAGRWLRRRG